VWIIKGVLTLVSFVSKVIQVLELWLAYRAGQQHQILADRSADVTKLQAEAQAAANAGTAQDALSKGKF
jgi:hypothetical protein